MKPTGALVALVCLAALWGCGGDDSSESGSAALDKTLSVLRVGQAEEACALLTERFVLDSYGAMGARGRERCVKEAGVLGTGRDVEIVEEADDQVVVEIVADDEAGFFSLIPVNGRWLVDGVAIDPDGAISGQGTAGGPGIAACCIDVQATPSG